MTNVPTRIEASAAPDLYVVMDSVNEIWGRFLTIWEAAAAQNQLELTHNMRRPHRVVHYTAHQEATQAAQDAEARELLRRLTEAVDAFEAADAGQSGAGEYALMEMALHAARAYLAKGVQA